MHFLWEILQEILWEIFKICKSSVGNDVRNSVGNVGNAAGNAVGNLAANDLGNYAVFSLNTIYCLQTIHKPACIILTLFQFLHFCANFWVKIQNNERYRNSALFEIWQIDT